MGDYHVRFCERLAGESPACLLGLVQPFAAQLQFYAKRGVFKLRFLFGFLPLPSIKQHRFYALKGIKRAVQHSSLFGKRLAKRFFLPSQRYGNKRTNRPAITTY